MAGNRLAAGRGWKNAIKRSIGTVNDATLDELVRTALVLFSAELRTMPADTPGVRSELAAMVRRTVTAAHYQDEAVRAGLATPEGLVLTAASLKHDQAASRHRHSAYIAAVAAANARPQGDPMEAIRASIMAEGDK